MAHPKSRISKQRKRKRRTHKVATAPQVATCKTTGEKHLFHHAYWVGTDLYYKGQVIIKGADEI